MTRPLPTREQIAAVLAIHARNEVVEPDPVNMPGRTRVKCQGEACDFYGVYETWHLAVEAHNAHVADALLAADLFPDVTRFAEDEAVQAFLSRWDIRPAHHRYFMASLAAALAPAQSERCACGRLTLDTTVSERHDRGLHGPTRCIGAFPAQSERAAEFPGSEASESRAMAEGPRDPGAFKAEPRRPRRPAQSERAEVEGGG